MLRVKILHFVHGVTALNSQQSVSAGKVDGMGMTAPAKSIMKVPGGYLIDYAGKLVVVHEHMVEDAVMEWEDPAEESEPQPRPIAQPPRAAAPPPPPSQLPSGKGGKSKNGKPQPRQAVTAPSDAGATQPPPPPVVLEGTAEGHRVREVEVRPGVFQNLDTGAFYRKNPTPMPKIGPVQPTSDEDDAPKEDAEQVHLGGHRQFGGGAQ